MGILKDKKGLVIGIANQRSIAWACARAFYKAGATLGGTWLSDKSRPHVEPLLDALGADIRRPLDVLDDSQMQGLFEEVQRRWGRLDFLLHSIAFAPKADLLGRLVDSSRDGFGVAMDVSCHSFIRLARQAEPLMTEGGSLITMSYLGSSEVVRNYGIMGPVKAALESATRYLAAELGPAGIRVNAISPGPIPTRAASGLSDFDALVADSAARAPMRGPLTIDDVGPLCAFLASDGARAMTGSTLFVDGGYHILN
ncbi:enoyl-ACP reductase FabI [Pseudoxanthomonas mexicana]|jgi:enoyl-[acyl-carrier protein] reductase I|uniref:enoyl-ACP reductase FabI n=1 Tax=Pseudoxanthomonas mexicana TaxID=128785 RepID=UPI000DB5902D|nr:enoyl-ACP reductase FabI [Pseudoxanthomonas mexicana]KAF1727965.1 enoyl-[acyl-carrier-protein] reductase FabI [Pseudoxanthomonas mexicana]PZQ32596.1 MAG: enoyl-[acyl-carrier-protein] reductase FabI [Stenotrophomonas acidaminiphila]